MLWFLSCSPAPAESPLTFSTTGGEAWTFHKSVELSISRDACDEVRVASALGALVARPDGRRVSVYVPLASGPNHLVAECLKDGVKNGEPVVQNWLVRLPNVPRAAVALHATPSSLVLDASSSVPATVSGTPIVTYEWRARHSNPSSLALPASGPKIELHPPSTDGEYYVTLRVGDLAGRTDESTVMFRVRGGKPEPSDYMRDHAAWIDDAVIYGVMPQAFGERGLVDVTARLDWLAKLGTNTLWLAPVTASAPRDFGYAVIDHFKLRGSLGSEDDLRTLIAAAHARGMRVILDFVPNHVSDQHAYFLDVVRQGRTSPYYNFFARTPSGEPSHYFEWKNLENLNYDNPEVQQLVIEAFAHWLRTFDVDGFRVDVAWGPRERLPGFWARWRHELKRIKPDLLLLAEASARDPFYGNNGFDAAYDWTDKLGVWAWNDAFAATDATSTVTYVRQALRPTPSQPDTLVFRFLNNNDTGARFLTRHGPARTRVATAMLLTLPGLPGLYTGDEVGAALEPYRGRSTPIAWEDPHGLLAWHAQLIGLRRSVPALRSNIIRVIDIASAHEVLAYLRAAPSGNNSVVVLLNYGADGLQVALPEHELRALAPDGKLSDLLTGEPIDLSKDNPAFELVGHGVRVLTARPWAPAPQARSP
jgi:glycosidase